METITADPVREPWNKGKFVGQKTPFKLKEIWAIRIRLQIAHRCRPRIVQPRCHLSTRQYARIVDSWVLRQGLDPANFGTHTLRRTNATLLYGRRNNLRAVQLLLGHTKLESTVRYLGIEAEDALEMAEQTEA
jgi:integrase